MNVSEYDLKIKSGLMISVFKLNAYVPASSPDDVYPDDP